MNNSPRRYHGPVRAVILDWAGTSVDFGCHGPVQVFNAAFQRFGLDPNIAEIRAPMGREKKEHVRAMLNAPRLSQLWQEKKGHRPVEEDVEAIFASVQELMPVVLADYAEPVPGCVEAMHKLHEMNIAIGSCTGYSRAMMVNMLPKARAAGFIPDCLVCADEVPAGRPMPWMCWQNCMRLGVYPQEAVVKVGDTLPDIAEGINAGHWSVGVTRTSSSIGLDEQTCAKMAPEELAQKEKELAQTFLDAGANFVISSVADLPDLCEKISALLAKGERP